MIQCRSSDSYRLYKEVYVSGLDSWFNRIDRNTFPPIQEDLGPIDFEDLIYLNGGLNQPQSLPFLQNHEFETHHFVSYYNYLFRWVDIGDKEYMTVIDRIQPTTTTNPMGWVNPTMPSIMGSSWFLPLSHPLPSYRQWRGRNLHCC